MNCIFVEILPWSQICDVYFLVKLEVLSIDSVVSLYLQLMT